MLRTRLLALCMALFVLLPSTAMASVVYHCKMTGRSGPSCCCSSHEKRVVDAGSAKLERPACCTAERAEAEGMPGLTEASRVDVPPATVLQMAFQVPEPRRAAPRAAPFEQRCRAPPALGPPLFVKHCVFLI